MIKLSFLIFNFSFLIFIGCEGGIEPQPGDAGFGGKITFIGEWPDSITRTHLVIFKEPLLSTSDFSLSNIRFVSNEIPFGVTEYVYSSRDSSVLPGTGLFEPGEYAYVAVAQSTEETVSLIRSDWFVVGIYYNQGNSSGVGILTIPQNTYVEQINIVCDFNNPPPQPPGGD